MKMKNKMTKMISGLILLAMMAGAYFANPESQIHKNIPVNHIETVEDNVELAEGEIPEYHRDDWEDRSRNSFYDPIRDKKVGMRNYQLYLATGVDITDPEQFSYSCYYCGEEFSDYNKFDWDHIVPLAYAHEHGAYTWTHEQKVDFAHDFEVGVLSCAKCNRGKGAKGPSEWMPELHKEEYCKLFEEICQNYELQMSEEDAQVVYSYIVH